MNPQQLIEMNNEKRELLTEENKRIYGDMLVYVRMASIAEHHVEEVLMDLLDHLLDAQEHGKTADDVFGPDLKAYCDEVIDALPKYTFWQKLRAYMFVPYLIISIIFAIEAIAVTIMRIIDHSNEELQTFFINPLGLLSLITCSFILLVIAEKWLRKSAFSQEKESTRTLFIIWLVLTLLLGCGFGGNILFKKLGWLMFPVPLWLGIGLTIVFYLLYSVSFNRSGRRLQ